MRYNKISDKKKLENIRHGKERSSEVVLTDAPRMMNVCVLEGLDWSP